MARGAAYQSTRLTHCLFARSLRRSTAIPIRATPLAKPNRSTGIHLGGLHLWRTSEVLKYIIKERFRNRVRVKERTVSRQGASLTFPTRCTKCRTLIE